MFNIAKKVRRARLADFQKFSRAARACEPCRADHECGGAHNKNSFVRVEEDCAGHRTAAPDLSPPLIGDPASE
jgi:hypothetical protein